MYLVRRVRVVPVLLGGRLKVALTFHVARRDLEESTDRLVHQELGVSGSPGLPWS